MKPIPRCSSRTLLALALLCSHGAAATTWHVDVHGTPPGSGSANDPFTSIQDAVSRASTADGDTLLIAPGTYFETLDLSGKAITIRSSAGAAETIIDAQGAGSVVRFEHGETAATVLDDLTLTGGVGQGRGPASRGGGVLCWHSSPTLSRLVISDNQAFRGAGLCIESGAPSITDCVIEHNEAIDTALMPGQGGGVWSSCDSAPEFAHCTIAHNRGALEGGGAWGSGSYSNCTIADNEAFRGAGAYSNACRLEFAHCELSTNSTNSIIGERGEGGGVFGPARLSHCTLRGNSSCRYGAGAVRCVLDDCVIAENTVEESPGGSAGRGGGAFECALSNCEVVGNTIHGRGGSANAARGAGVYGGEARSSRIHANHAVGGHGGGAACSTLVDCSVFDNVASVDPLHPGAVEGGGLFASHALRTAIYRNRAPRGAGSAGGTLVSCTLSLNVALETGGGVYASTAETNVHDSILWNDQPDEVATSAGKAASGAGSLAITFSDVQGGSTGAGNIDADPQFWIPIAADFALRASSPCIDAGNPARPKDADASRADIGALPFERGHCPAPTRYCSAKPNSLACLPAIGWSGNASFSAQGDLHFSATEVRNQQTGVLVWSIAGAATPFAGGTLCLRGALVRTPAQSSGGSPLPAADCSGSYDFHFSNAYARAQGIVPSQTIYAQFLTRDPAHPDGTGKGLTDALAITFCP